MLIFAIGTVLVCEILPIVLINYGLFESIGKIPNETSPSFDITASVILCTMVIAIYESIYFFKKYSDSLHEREKLAKANMHAQLSALKQQVNPHFLFNSLNTLANVIPEDPELAVLFVQRLAAVYRRVIDYRHRDLVSLEEELVALKDYAFLLHTRFEDKFQIRISHRIAATSLPSTSKFDESCILADNFETRKPATSGGNFEERKIVTTKVAMSDSSKDPTFNTGLPAELSGLMIPPLSLQLLVENAVKHNVASTACPLVVSIEITPNEVKVSNPLNLRIHREESTGLGHQNIRQRYRLLTEREVRIDRRDDHFKVSLPLLRPKERFQHATA